MIRYLLYLLIIYSVIKMYRYRFRNDNQIIYASLSLIIGIITIDWILPKSIKNNQPTCSQSNKVNV